MHGRKVALLVSIATALAAAPARAADDAYFGGPEAYATGSWPEAVAIGDVTGDGLNDVLMTTSFYFDEANDYKLFLFAQRAAGGYHVSRLNTAAGYGDSMGIALGDVDGDGDRDVVVATEAGVDLFRQAAGTLQSHELIPGSPAGAYYVATGNLDGTGPDEIFVTDGSGTHVIARDGSPTGWRTTEVAPSSGAEIETGDLNGDGRLDLVVMTSGVTVYLQEPDGSFTRQAHSISASGLAVGDVTGDGRDDLVATRGGNRPASKVDVYAQTPAGGLADPLTYASYDIPEPVEIHDMNGDGRKDVVTLHGGWNAAGVYSQLVTGTLNGERLWGIPYASHYNPDGIALGDVDSDGRPDLAIADYNSGLVLLRQADPPPDEPIPGDPDGDGDVGGDPTPTPTPTPSATPTPTATPNSSGVTVSGGAPAPTSQAGGGTRNLLKVVAGRTARVGRGGVVRVTCSRGCLVSARAVVRWKQRGTRAGAQVLVPLRPVHRRLARNRTVQLRLKLSRAARREVAPILRRGIVVRLDVVLEAEDADGEVAARTVTVRLRR
jgi:hypothetical protein